MRRRDRLPLHRCQYALAGVDAQGQGGVANTAQHVLHGY
jgi:hypothetical protein